MKFVFLFQIVHFLYVIMVFYKHLIVFMVWKSWQRASCLGRRPTINPSETLSFLETEPDFLSSRPEPEVFGGRFYRHVRHPSPDGLAEVFHYFTVFNFSIGVSYSLIL